MTATPALRGNVNLVGSKLISMLKFTAQVSTNTLFNQFIIPLLVFLVWEIKYKKRHPLKLSEYFSHYSPRTLLQDT